MHAIAEQVRLLSSEIMPAAVRILALATVAVVVCCCALLFAASVPIELLEAPAHTVATGKVVHPAVAAALNAAHVQHPAANAVAAKVVAAKAVAAKVVAAKAVAAKVVAAKAVAAHTSHPLSAAQQQHKLKVEAELENAEHMREMASEASTKAFNLALSIHTQAEKMTSDADKALKAKNLALNKSLRAKAHTLWLQERQALDEVSKDRNLEKQEEAAVARAGSEAATLAARMDKRILAVNQELNDAKQEALKSQQEMKQANAIKPSLLAVKKALLQTEANAKKAETQK